MIQEIKKDLHKFSRKEKAAFFPRFFKTSPGQYGEGDKFIGVTVPDCRSVAKKYAHQAVDKTIEALIGDPIHEVRLTGLLMLVQKFQKSKTEAEQKKVVDLYLKNLKGVNNWDLVDLSAGKILGAWLADKDRSLLIKLAASKNLWKERVAIVATFEFIRQNDFSDTLKIARMFIDHPHDLIHKAVGWMLREVGKRDKAVLIKFLKEHAGRMPRVMFRYATERIGKDF